MFKHILTVIILFYAVTPSLADNAHARETGKEFNPDEIIAYVRYLSSDELEGRMTGEKGCEIAADCIARHFKESGLEPRGDKGTYFQNFPLPETVTPGESNSLKIMTKSGEDRLEMEGDFFPLDISAHGFSSGELAFAGYGISAPDPGYDNYEGLDVKGKIVIALRGAPRDLDHRSNFYDY